MTERFAQIPLSVIASKELTPIELKVLAALYLFRNAKSGKCCPRLSSIAEITGHKKNNEISRITSSIQNKGYLSKRQTGYNRANQYDLLVPVIKYSESKSDLEKTYAKDDSLPNELEKSTCIATQSEVLVAREPYTEIAADCETEHKIKQTNKNIVKIDNLMDRFFENDIRFGDSNETS